MTEIVKEDVDYYLAQLHMMAGDGSTATFFAQCLRCQFRRLIALAGAVKALMAVLKKLDVVTLGFYQEFVPARDAVFDAFIDLDMPPYGVAEVDYWEQKRRAAALRATLPTEAEREG